MGKNTTTVNGRSPVTKNSAGTVVAFPDVCKTPSPGGPIPIPYPNISKSSDLADGSKTVTIDGASVCLKGSTFATSTGNEAGSAGGVISGKIKGKAEPIMFSFDVKIEGRPVVRNMDLFLANDKNTPPAPVMQSQPAPAAAPAPATSDEEQEKCEFCEKPVHDFADDPGSNLGSSAILEGHIFKGRDKKAHPWYSGPFALQAHHLVCSEAVDDDEWHEICWKFGYDVNHRHNGVMLPGSMPLACQTFAPLHRGPHHAGEADGLPYPKRIAQLARELKRNALAGTYCADPKQLVADMDDLSRRILAKVDAFQYTLTADGGDYKAGGCGCSGKESLTDKAKVPCPQDRRHELKRSGVGPAIARKSAALKIGE